MIAETQAATAGAAATGGGGGAGGHPRTGAALCALRPRPPAVPGAAAAEQGCFVGQRLHIACECVSSTWPVTPTAHMAQEHVWPFATCAVLCKGLC
jgi:hypothetical protein